MSAVIDDCIQVKKGMPYIKNTFYGSTENHHDKGYFGTVTESRSNGRITFRNSVKNIMRKAGKKGDTQSYTILSKNSCALKNKEAFCAALNVKYKGERYFNHQLITDGQLIHFKNTAKKKKESTSMLGKYITYKSPNGTLYKGFVCYEITTSKEKNTYAIIAFYRMNKKTGTFDILISNALLIDHNGYIITHHDTILDESLQHINDNNIDYTTFTTLIICGEQPSHGNTYITDYETKPYVIPNDTSYYKLFADHVIDQFGYDGIPNKPCMHGRLGLHYIKKTIKNGKYTGEHTIDNTKKERYTKLVQNIVDIYTPSNSNIYGEKQNENHSYNNIFMPGGMRSKRTKRSTKKHRK